MQMRVLRFIPLAIGWIVLGISVIIFFAATGIGVLGEAIIKLAFIGQESEAL